MAPTPSTRKRTDTKKRVRSKSSRAEHAAALPLGLSVGEPADRCDRNHRDGGAEGRGPLGLARHDPLRARALQLVVRRHVHARVEGAGFREELFRFGSVPLYAAHPLGREPRDLVHRDRQVACFPVPVGGGGDGALPPARRKVLLQEAEEVASEGDPRRRALCQPHFRLHHVLPPPVASAEGRGVAERHPELGRAPGVPERRRAKVEVERHHGVLLHARGGGGRRSDAPPREGALVGGVQLAQPQHRVHVPLLRRQTQPRERLDRVRGHGRHAGAHIHDKRVEEETLRVDFAVARVDHQQRPRLRRVLLKVDRDGLRGTLQLPDCPLETHRRVERSLEERRCALDARADRGGRDFHVDAPLARQLLGVQRDRDGDVSAILRP
mmetsp:Transcript_9940/g.24313  ORF Transcript_9940/g.24313 Transcript_9940/m.24313 type:complete len:382 (+) Transcript_9940:208-1353(+)